MCVARATREASAFVASGYLFFQNLNMEYDGFEDLNGFEDGLLPSQTEFVQFDPNIGVGGNYRGEKYYGSYDLGGARTGDRCKSY